MDNATIAQMFSTMADALTIEGANVFRVNAYRRAAEIIVAYPHAVTTLDQKSLLTIPGIGKGIAANILEVADTGACTEYTDIMHRVPKGLLDMLAIEGMGPKTTQLVWKKFGVMTIAQLEKLLASGKLEGIPGFGHKKVENIQSGIRTLKSFGGRQPLGMAYVVAEQIVEALKEHAPIDRIAIAGSVRRMKEDIGDIDILVTSKKPDAATGAFVHLPQVHSVVGSGSTKTTVTLKNGMQCELRVVAPDEFGSALHHLTGSKEHNVHLRMIAQGRGLTINEYGVFRVGTRRQSSVSKSEQKRIARKTEESIFNALGLPFIPPELREDRGEIEAAQHGTLPKLIEEKQIHGDLHVHSTWSDGTASIIDMIRAAKARGLRYIAMTDHASPMGMVKGLKEDTVDRYVRDVRAAAKKVGGIDVLVGSEVDIMQDGSLYLSDVALAKLDFVVASVHSHFKLSKKVMTARIIRAMEHPRVSVIGHLTTRKVCGRLPIDLDMDAIMRAAKRTGTLLELNASWQRLDLNDVHCRMAKEYGVRVVISTDSHAPADFEAMRWGVATARRGWLEKKDVANAAATLHAFKKMLT